MTKQKQIKKTPIELEQEQREKKKIVEAEFKDIKEEAKEVKEVEMTTIDKQVQQNEIAKTEIAESLLATFKSQEEDYEKDLKEIEDKKAKILEQKKQKEQERELFEGELKKLSPVLSGDLKEILRLNKEIKEKQEELHKKAEVWREQAKNANLSEAIISRLTNVKPAGERGQKVDVEAKKELILKSVKEGHNNMSALYKIPGIGMSQNTRDAVQTLLDEKKLAQNASKKYYVP